MRHNPTIVHPVAANGTVHAHVQCLPDEQGLTLVHFSAPPEHHLWDELVGVSETILHHRTAQVELPLFISG